jgi:serine/threonine protein kinase
MKTRIVKSMGTDARALPKAPEQTLGYAGCESDIYSLAKVLIEMLTGKTALQLFPDAALDLPDRIRKFLALAAYGLSENSIGLIAAALEFDPQRRPPGRPLTIEFDCRRSRSAGYIGRVSRSQRFALLQRWRACRRVSFATSADSSSVNPAK